MDMLWKENANGLLELVLENGEILREKRRRPPRKQRGPRRPGRPSKAELSQVSPNQSEPQERLYNPDAIAEKISDVLMKGADFKLLGPQYGCASQAVIARLRRENPKFARKIQDAIEVQQLIRQDALESKIMDTVEAAQRRGDEGAGRLTFEAYRWRAEQSDPATYRRRPGRPRKSLLQAILRLLPGQTIVPKS
jgi:hypothetical protein